VPLRVVQGLQGLKQKQKDASRNRAHAEEEEAEAHAAEVAALSDLTGGGGVGGGAKGIMRLRAARKGSQSGMEY
jgi:hypothetical protein